MNSDPGGPATRPPQQDNCTAFRSFTGGDVPHVSMNSRRSKGVLRPGAGAVRGAPETGGAQRRRQGGRQREARVDAKRPGPAADSRSARERAALGPGRSEAKARRATRRRTGRPCSVRTCPAEPAAADARTTAAAPVMPIARAWRLGGDQPELRRQDQDPAPSPAAIRSAEARHARWYPPMYSSPAGKGLNPCCLAEPHEIRAEHRDDRRTLPDPLERWRGQEVQAW